MGVWSICVSPSFCMVCLLPNHSFACFLFVPRYICIYVYIYIYPQLQLRNASHNIKAEGKGNTNKIISKIKKIKIKSYKKEVKIINKTPSTELSKIFNEKPPPPPPPPIGE
ncbi:hypothetical protein TWF706_003124 [Orbilia oligospora]|nr:hypothetical protein TWF706_003124 [Orbilia oligospora]